MIGNLLNPNAKHYQDSLFLEQFLKIIELDKWRLNLSNTTVSIEYKDIDLYITDGDKHIIIENKIWAEDQPCQIMKYINIIVEENKDSMNLSHIEFDHIILDENVLQVIYLTPRIKDVSSAHEIDNKGYIYFHGIENADTELSKCSKRNNTELLVPAGLKKYKAKYKKITYREHIIGDINCDSLSVIKERKEKLSREKLWPKMCQICALTTADWDDKEVFKGIYRKVKKGCYTYLLSPLI